MVGIDNLIKTIITPLVEFPEEIAVVAKTTDRFDEYHLQLNENDIGRIIGQQGHVIQTIRTILYSIPTNGSKLVRLVIDEDKG